MPTENRSSNTEQMVSAPFSREDRYIVIKRSDLEKLPAAQRHDFSRSCRIVHEQMFAAGAPARSFLTIESDWPEYEPVWSMIEARVTGRPTSDGFSAGDMADQGAKAFAARDPEVEELRELLRAMTCGYRMAVQAGHARITALGGDCDSVDRMLADFPEYAKAIAATKRKS